MSRQGPARTETTNQTFRITGTATKVCALLDQRSLYAAAWKRAGERNHLLIARSTPETDRAYIASCLKMWISK